MTCSRSLQGLAATIACALLSAPAALADPTTAFASAAAKASSAKGENTPLKLDTSSGAGPAGGGGSTSGIVRTIVGLAVVIGVIYGLHWILKTVKSNRETRSTGGGLEPISTLALGPGRALHLIRAGAEIVLVGTGEHGVTPIRTYSEHEARELGLLDLETDGGEPEPRRPRAAGALAGVVTGLLYGPRKAAAGQTVEAAGPANPMRAAAGSPATVRDLVRTVQRWTVRG